MAFAGYLIKLGGASGTVLPVDYMKAESYTVEDRTTENENRKSVTGLTWRSVAPHRAVQVKFKTKALTNTSLAALEALISGAMEDELTRNIEIQYYDPRTDSYKTANCYMPDVPYTIGKIESGNVIKYPGFEYTFNEY